MFNTLPSTVRHLGVRRTRAVFLKYKGGLPRSYFSNMKVCSIKCSNSKEANGGVIVSRGGEMHRLHVYRGGNMFVQTHRQELLE